MSDMDIIKPVIAAAVGRRDASGPINTLAMARVMGLERELAELRELQKFVPSGPAGAINCRKAEKLLEQPNMRTTGLVLANTETGDRTLIDMSAVRWMESGEFQEMMHPAWSPLTASQGPAPGATAAGPAQKAPVADAAQDEPFPGEERVAVPRALIGAACCAIARKRDGTKVLAALRRYTTGDLSAAIKDPANPATPCQGHAAQQEREEGCSTKELLEALRFYAEGHHFAMHDPCNWDTVSGEPQNFLEDAGNTATVEDGSIAKAAIARSEAALEELKKGGSA